MKKKKNMSSMSVRIVLVRPRNPLNIGAAARAMANFGFSDLVVVNPYEPIWRQTVSAVGAEKLVLNARKVRSVGSAIGDCDWVLGTTTTDRRKLANPLVELPEWNTWLKKRKTPPRQMAVLFGSEKNGLHAKHLSLCHHVLTVPTSDDCPSMNLGQAVAVCCYEFSKAFGKIRSLPKMKGLSAPVAKDMDQLVRHARDAFQKLDYLTFLSPEVRTEKIRRTFLRWNLHEGDLSLIHGFLRYVLKTKKTGAGS